MIPTELVREAMEQFGVPGVAIGLIHDGEEEFAGFGVTSLENPLPVDGDTLFQIGSISKTYTATAVMRLVDAGRLSLDEPVRTYLPELRLADKSVTRAVTLRHLLSHTGGWVGDYFESITAGDDALTQMVARLHRLEQLTPLGQVWSYNNAGFYIAGRVIEVVTGKPFESALGALVLEPLGLERSFFFAGDVLTYRFAVGHDRTGAVMRPWAIGRPAAPVGGIIASVRELLKYARLQWDWEGFLSRKSIEEMRRPHIDVGRALGDAVGLGWYLFEIGGHSFVMHGGSTSGQNARLLVGTQDQFALAILANQDNGAAVMKEVQIAVMEAVFGIKPHEEPRLSLSRDELAQYTGDYDSALTAAKLAMVDGELVLELTLKGGFPEPNSPARPGPPATRLAFDRKDAVIALDPPMRGDHSDFLRGPHNEIAWFRLGGRLYRRVDKNINHD